jgi:hypothetical protein
MGPQATEHGVFALGESDLNRFLFADIGPERSGMPLTVISALARLGLDPWQEAGRLARLPRTVATDGLAALIAGMPASLWSVSDATPIAASLVALLPGQNDNSAASGMHDQLKWRWLLIVGVTAAILATSFTNIAIAPNSFRPAPASMSAPMRPVQPPMGD